jgi:hypothetical protein
VICGYSSAFDTPICALADEQLLGLADVGPAREQIRRQTRRQGRGRDLLFERPPALHRPRVLPEQDVDEVLGLHDLALDVRNRPRRGVEQRFRLPHVEDPRHAAVQPRLHEFE